MKQLLDEVERLRALEASRRREIEILQTSETEMLAKSALYRQAISVLVSPRLLLQQCWMGNACWLPEIGQGAVVNEGMGWS